MPSLPDKGFLPIFPLSTFRQWKVSTRLPPEPSLLQGEVPQLSHVFTVEILQPSCHLSNFLWTHSNMFMSSLCWDSRAEHSTHKSRGEESPPSTCWPLLFWCIPGWDWLSGLSVNTASTYAIPTTGSDEVHLGRTYSPHLAWVICLIPDSYQRCPKLGQIISTLKSLKCFWHLFKSRSNLI